MWTIRKCPHIICLKQRIERKTTKPYLSKKKFDATTTTKWSSLSLVCSHSVKEILFFLLNKANNKRIAQECTLFNQISSSVQKAIGKQQLLKIHTTLTRDCFAFIVWLIFHFFCLSICLAFLLIHKKWTERTAHCNQRMDFCVMDIDGYSNSSFVASVSIIVIPWALMCACDTSTVINRCITEYWSQHNKKKDKLLLFSLSHTGKQFLLFFLWFLLIFIYSSWSNAHSSGIMANFFFVSKFNHDTLLLVHVICDHWREKKTQQTIMSLN